MGETALRLLLDSALLSWAFPDRPVPAPVPQARAVVVLRYRAELSVEQVTGVLGCAAGNVNRHNAQALATLQAVLGEALADPGSAGGPGREQTEPREEPRWMKLPCGSCWTAP